MTSTALPKPRIRVRTDGTMYPSPSAGFQPGFASRPGFATPSGYMRGNSMPLFMRWNPALREASDDVRAAWRLATARSVEQIQNSGFLAGCAEQSASSVVGNGLELSAKPNADTLGWTQTEANDWAQKVEKRFSIWADSPRACDAGGRFTFGQLQAQAYRHWMATGEILATLPFFKRTGSNFGTKLKILPAWRMSLRTMLPDMISGVRLDPAGGPMAYLLRRRMLYGDWAEVEVPANDNAGRPLVVHIFDGEPDQIRGISPFTPILRVTRQFDQLADATLTTALIQTVFAAMFKSAAKPEEVLGAMQADSHEKDDFVNLLGEKARWYEKTDVNLGIHGKILHGFPGDELQFFRSEHPNGNYDQFAKFLLLECSRVCAMTYEEFSGDFSKSNYSAIQMGGAVVWPRVLYRRKHVVGPLAQKGYEAWLEEDIEAGNTPFPGGIDGFLANREAASQASWRGPSKPRADDLKAARAAQFWQEVGVPDSVLFAELGGDVDDWYEQRKREQDRRNELGLKDRTMAVSAPTVAPSGPDETDQPDSGSGDGSGDNQQGN